ncbi:unnamed protein product [Closterium sp. NIES-64]|nr:unnamed protein product [Closterium sp. NIES-64]
MLWFRVIVRGFVMLIMSAGLRNPSPHKPPPPPYPTPLPTPPLPLPNPLPPSPLSPPSQFTTPFFSLPEVVMYGMSVGLKNPGPLAPSHMAGLFDWALVKECNQYTDWSGGEWYSGRYGCNYAKEFIVRNKAVFVAEYVESWGNSAGVQNGIRFPQWRVERNVKGGCVYSNEFILCNKALSLAGYVECWGTSVVVKNDI